MIKEIIAVYQDCVLCGTKGRQKIADYAAQGIQIRKVGFTTPEGKELCYQAVQKGIGYMPFYVSDGDFAENIEALIAKPAKNVKNKPKKPAKNVKKTKIIDKGTDNGNKADN